MTALSADIAALPDRTLLVLDDDAPRRTRLGRALEQRGFETTLVGSVAEALASVKSHPPAYAVLDMRLEDGSGLKVVEAVREARPDFLQVNYSVISRGAESAVFPLAQELGVAVLINRAFEDGRLFARVKDKPLPPWAAEAGIESWAQAFLRFALSHPAVTVVIPATGKPDRQSDNLKAGQGPMLNAQQRRSLIDAVG